MKTLILFLALFTMVTARPTIETVKDADMPAVIVAWHHHHYARPKPFRAKETVPGLLEAGDVILWETYPGQPLAVGDWFIADYPTKKMFNAIRECRKVTDTEITTLAGTTIPLSQVKGVVVRVIRTIP